MIPVDAPLSAALTYLSAGLSVIPVKTDGTKAPALKDWREFSERQPTEAELYTWFADPTRHGVGIPGGPASGNLCVLDFEQWSAFTCWGTLLAQDERQLLRRCPVIKTPKGGAHAYCRLTEAVKGAKYARTAGGACLIETRGNGHQVVAPGSPLSCHPSGRPYRVIRDGWLDGGPFEPIPIDVWHNLTLHAAELNEYARPKAHEVVADRPHGRFGDRPGDAFNVRVSWGDVLSPSGWRVYRSTEGATYWCRPGKSPAGISASTGFCRGPSGCDLLYVFSTSAAPFEAETSYSRFGVYALLHHHGDFTAAARALGLAGYGRSLAPSPAPGRRGERP